MNRASTFRSVKAMKEHMCSTCHKPILAGETYAKEAYQAGIDDRFCRPFFRNRNHHTKCVASVTIPTGTISKADLGLLELVRSNVGLLARACWLASAWQESSADAENESDPEAAAGYLRDGQKLLKMEKDLKRYQAKHKKP